MKSRQFVLVCLILCCVTALWFAKSLDIKIDWMRGMFSDNHVNVVETPSVHIQVTSYKQIHSMKQVQHEIRVTKTPPASIKVSKPNVRQSNTNEVSMLEGIRVYTRDYQQWNKNDICEALPSFQRATLKLEIGSTPIFIHNPKIDKFVSANLLRKGSWEEGYVSLIVDLLKQNKKAQFLDLGAMLGVFSLAAAKLGRKVISVDPLGINVKRMCKSFEEGKLVQNTTIVFNAISDEIQNVSLAKDLNNVGGTFVLQDKNNNKVKGSVVNGQYHDPIMTANLDHLLELPGFDGKDMVVKMDVEGYELKVLKSGKKFFEKVNIIAVLMEWNFHRRGNSGLEIIKFFKDRNYEPVDSMMRFRKIELCKLGNKLIYKKLCESENRLKYRYSKKWPGDVLWIKQQ